MTESGLVVWSVQRLPGTCQTLTDVDEETGELVITVWGLPPAPEPPSNVLNGVVTAGRVVYKAAENECTLRDVKIVPLPE